MNLMKKLVATAAMGGLLALGVVVGTGGSALAATGTPVTACSAAEGALTLGLLPNCTAGNSTVKNPTSITVTLNTTALGALLGVIPGLGIEATWTLSCVVNGTTVSAPGSYTVTSTSQSASKTVGLQSAVGSPEPAQCTVSGLKVATTLVLTLGALGLSPFIVGVSAAAETAVPGAIWQSAGAASGGARAALCADDAHTGNTGSTIQAWTCLSDLADYVVVTSAGQLVHNGDCVGLNGGKVVLQACTAGNQAQQWVRSAGGTMRNRHSGTCLTAPATKSGTALIVRACTSAANRKWTAPPATA